MSSTIEQCMSEKIACAWEREREKINLCYWQWTSLFVQNFSKTLKRFYCLDLANEMIPKLIHASKWFRVFTLHQIKLNYRCIFWQRCAKSEHDEFVPVCVCLSAYFFFQIGLLYNFHSSITFRFLFAHWTNNKTLKCNCTHIFRLSTPITGSISQYQQHTNTGTCTHTV